MGYLLVTAVLVVTFGRLGDMYGRVRIYNARLRGLHRRLGRARARPVRPRRRRDVADRSGGWCRASAAPCCSPTRPRSSPTRSRPRQRGLALGINQVAAIAGCVPRPDPRRRCSPSRLAAVFLCQRARSASSARSGPTVSLHETGRRSPARHRLVGQRHLRRRPVRAARRDHLRHPALRRHTMGWTNPWVRRRPARRRRAARRFLRHRDARRRRRCSTCALFRIRAFAAGNAAGLLASIARGGLQFMLIIWLQGIWLPLHGYSFERHPAVGRHLPAAADRRLPRSPGRCPARCPTGSARARSPPAACCSSAATLRRAAAAARSTSPTGCSPC